METTANTPPALLPEARAYANWHPNIVIKVAMYSNGDGLRVVHQLRKKGIKTNIAGMVTFNQLLLACKAGATYISLFFNRARDAGEDPVQIIKDITTIMNRENFESRLIVGSIRKPTDVIEAATTGAHITTIPFKILAQMPHHPKTEETIKEFDEAWKKFQALTPTMPQPP